MSRTVVRSVGACLFSTIVHLIIVLSLGLWMMPDVLRNVTRTIVSGTMDEPEDDLQTVELDDNIAATDMNFAISTAPTKTTEVPEITNPELDKQVLDEDFEKSNIALDDSLSFVPSRDQILREVPDGAPGVARNVADNYAQAIDRITREIMWMLSKQKVLIIWCFDQSGSMKDDQKEIRGKIERVYAELGLSDKATGDALTTAVTSYGEKFTVHTKRPTFELEEIRKAIDSVPSDPSGKEMMCQGVGRAIAMHRKYAARGQRGMAMILVTDESGDREDNGRYLEDVISTAKAARCKVFVLGREAVFGYPYAFIRWKHPQTGRPHWLRIDRGPETAFVEQCQTNGFYRRHDAYPSGYGPYELSRLAHQTGGIYFMLPSLEAKLVRGEKRRYELEAMRGYLPDLRARMEIVKDRDKSKLRTICWKIISDLNPYNPNCAEVIELRYRFSIKVKEFVAQVGKEKGKARIYLKYLDYAAKELEKIKRYREEEPSPRWQANYDLLYAQLLAYKVRVYEYGVYLDNFVKHPQTAPLTKKPNLHMIDWHLGTRKETLTGDLTKPFIEHANKLFASIAKSHPGTPWGTRAQWEKGRGYGVRLYPYYEPPYKKVKNPTPIPKL